MHVQNEAPLPPSPAAQRARAQHVASPLPAALPAGSCSRPAPRPLPPDPRPPPPPRACHLARRPNLFAPRSPRRLARYCSIARGRARAAPVGLSICTILQRWHGTTPRAAESVHSLRAFRSSLSVPVPLTISAGLFGQLDPQHTAHAAAAAARAHSAAPAPGRSPGEALRCCGRIPGLPCSRACRCLRRCCAGAWKVRPLYPSDAPNHARAPPWCCGPPSDRDSQPRPTPHSSHPARSNRVAMQFVSKSRHFTSKMWL
jgi:hypothetical protein